MEILRKRIASFDRREFMKITGSAGLFALISRNALGAECPKETKPGLGLLYWVDGLHLEGGANGTDLISSATLSLYSEAHSMSDDSYVESVTLIDSTTTSALGVRYFRPTDKTSTGKAPFVIFENLTLRYGSQYLVIYTVRNKDKVILHTYDMSKATRTSISSPHVRAPLDMKNKIEATGGLSSLKATVPDYLGLITSPYVYYTSNGLTAHSARSLIQNIGANGTFSVRIEPMHGDVNVGHFMRYFIVADPVGRILGVKERTFGDGQSGQPQIVTQLRTNNDQINSLKAAVAGDTWGAADVGNINDCPYIQIFTEDAYDAIARQVVRLR
jgi:hypothetical protein